MIDIKVPTVGESISEVTLLKWTKKDGDYVERDEVIGKEITAWAANICQKTEYAVILKVLGYYWANANP